MNLIHHGKYTVAHEKLISGQTEEGAKVLRRGKGFTDYDVIKNLIKCGWLEEKAAGPRGGARYFTTESGLLALKSIGETP